MKIFLLSIFAILFLSGCGKKTLPPQTSPENRSSGIFSLTVIKADNTEYLKISKINDKYEITNNGKIIGSIEDKGEKLKIFDADNSAAGKVELDGADIKLKDANGKRIAKVKTESGSISIKDTANNKILKIKPDGADYKIDDSAGKKIGKIKNKGDKWLISDNSAEKFTISGNTNGGITGILLTDKVSPLQQAALIAGFNLLLQSGN